ncbi:MAG: hypothetical protein KJS97_05120 [Alphaproteobacteria bacterium]|nr:hypothetical protein [Alphaproteobacteria bacterium]
MQIDGKPLGDFGDADFSVHSFALSLIRSDESRARGGELDIHSHIGGLTRADADGHSYHYRWPVPEIGIGAVITIEIVDSDACIPAPVRRRSDAPATLESEFTAEEIRKMRYRDYLDLKKEFEVEGG